MLQREDRDLIETLASLVAVADVSVAGSKVSRSEKCKSHATDPIAESRRVQVAEGANSSKSYEKMEENGCCKHGRDALASRIGASAEAKKRKVQDDTHITGGRQVAWP